jgi:hypothetical protein
MDQDTEKPSLSLTSLTLANAALLFSKVGGQPIRVEMIQADLAAGAPANADGTLNLVHYAAWLIREMFAHD